MASVGDRFYNEDVGYEDMVEVPRRRPESKAKSILIGTVLIVAAVFVVVILVRGSLPELTPEQIVQQDEYQGQQPPRHIFNLYSLNQEKQRIEHEKEQEIVGASREVPADSGNSQAVELANETINQDAVPATGTGAIGRNTEIQAALKTQAATTYEKSELKRDSVLPVVASVSASEVVASSKPAASSEKSSELMILPVYTIGKNRVNLRSSPAFESRVLEILEKGQSITVFDNIGDWAQVATNDGAGTTGFIHNTMLEVADLNQ